MEEKQYRDLIDALLNRVFKAFDSVDPDIAECELQHGALNIKFASGARVILSAQPSVRQLWLAVASKGVAFHFNYDAQKRMWLDDKGQGIEPVSYLEAHVKEVTGALKDFKI